MNINIRQEQTGDHEAVYAVTEQAFRDMPFGDHDEQNLVEWLRKSSAFLPASRFGILSPIEVPDPVFMAVELVEGGLRGVSGTVEYPKEFFL